MAPFPSSSRVERLDLVARTLRDRPGITASEVARELGVSERSIFRDLDALRERGFPIEGERGRGGGLRLHPNWGLGRVLLSHEEALCTLLSLAMSEKLRIPMFATAAGPARRKIVDAFPAAERRRIAPLRERIFVGTPASARVRASYAEPAAAPSRVLQVAFVDERRVLAEYAREDGMVSERTLEPHAIVINWPAWYLVAFDLSRDASRTFRMDRFSRVQPLIESFRPRPTEMVRELVASGEVQLDRL